MPVHPPPDLQVISPSYSECDSVSGLLDNGNCDANKYPSTTTTNTKTRKLEALNQVRPAHQLFKGLTYQMFLGCSKLSVPKE